MLILNKLHTMFVTSVTYVTYVDLYFSGIFLCLQILLLQRKMRFNRKQIYTFSIGIVVLLALIFARYSDSTCKTIC